MGETLGSDDIDDADIDESAPGELASIAQDWDVVMQMLPAQWEAKASELGAVRRLRGSHRAAADARRLSLAPLPML